MAYTVIHLPVPPNRANDRSHWRKIQREKEQYYADCWYMSLMAFKGIMPGLPYEAIEYDAHWCVSKYYDQDNSVALLKWPQDALVKFGILASDDYFSCRGRNYPTQELRPKRKDVKELLLTIYPRGKFEK